MTLAAGSRLGPYEITAAIGAGGMGEVYRAHDSKLGRDVAVKVLPTAFARDPERLARFQREAKVLASLNHPNIAIIHGLEDSGAVHALVMELVEGPTLGDRIKEGPIAVDESLKIARHIADALEYAHERGIVHRDLKPANLKLTPDDAVKVLDFGLAKAFEGEASSIDIATSPTVSRLATQAGVLLGTAAYMSPEQAKGRAVDRRADIWAFGCVLYEMLTGKQTFGGETVTDTLAAVIKEDPDWSKLPSATPLRVRVLLQRCLQKDSKQRLRDIGDARISLDEVLSGAPDPALAGTRAEATPLWRRALPWAAAAALAVALAALGWAYQRMAGELAHPAAIVRFQVVPPANTALGGTFAMSPDGRQLAYAATETQAGKGTITRIWVRSIDSVESHPIPGFESTPDIASVFWSPDGRSIGFGDAAARVGKVDVSGDASQILCHVPGTVVLGASWSADGTILFGQASGGIMKVSANGGLPSPATALDASRGEIGHLFPSLLPDGRHFIYQRTSGGAEFAGIYLGSLDAKPGEQDLTRLVASATSATYVPSLNSGSGELLFVRGGSLLAQQFDPRELKLVGEPVTVLDHVGVFRAVALFSAAPNALVYTTGAGNFGSRLTWFDRQGKPLGVVGEMSADFPAISISPDGKQALATLFDQSLVLWLIDFTRDTSTRFTFGSTYAVGGAWSPDGSRIVFGANPKGVFDLYEKPANGAKDPELLFQSLELKIPTDWSRDGRFVLFNSANPQTKNDLWVMPPSADGKAAPFLRTEFNEENGRFSPDGRWVAYQSDESGSDEVYVRPFSPNAPGGASDSGGKWQISANGGAEPRWASDGRKLYFVSGDGKLMAADIANGPSFRAGAPEALFQVPGLTLNSTNLSAWDVMPDGKRFLFPVLANGAGAPPLTVVLNWQGALTPTQ